MNGSDLLSDEQMIITKGIIPWFWIRCHEIQVDVNTYFMVIRNRLRKTRTHRDQHTHTTSRRIVPCNCSQVRKCKDEQQSKLEREVQTYPDRQIRMGTKQTNDARRTNEGRGRERQKAMKQIERFIILIYVSRCRKQKNKQIRRPSVKYAAREKIAYLYEYTK